MDSLARDISDWGHRTERAASGARADGAWSARAALQAAVLLLSCGVLLYGLSTRPEILRGTWTPVGRTTFLELAGMFAVGASGIRAFFPRWLHSAVASAALALIVAAVGPTAPAAVVLFLASSHSLGFWLLDLLGRRERAVAPLERALAVVLGAASHSMLIGVLAHFRVNTPRVYLALLTLWLVARPNRAREAVAVIGRLLRPLPASDALATAGFVVAAFSAFLHLMAALTPEVGFDALAYHLTTPAHVAFHGFWGFDASRYVWAVMPMAGDWVYTALYMLAGEAGARLGNFAFLLLDAVLIFLAARRWSSAGVAWLVVDLFLSTPLLQLEVGSLFVENVCTAFVLGAVVATALYDEEARPEHAAAAAALAGAALAAKLIAAPTVVCVAALVCHSSRRPPGRPSSAAQCAVAVVLFSAYGLVPYAYAWLATGNPLFPFFNGLFRSPLFDSTQSFNNPLFNQPLSMTTLYDMTFDSHLFLEGSDGALGFSLLALLPLALLAPHRESPFVVKAAWAVLLFTFPVVFGFQSYLRYLTPLVAVAMLPVAWSLATLQRRDHPTLFRVVGVAAALVVGLNLYTIPAAGWFHRDLSFTDVLSPTARAAYVRRHAPERQINDYVNARYGDTARVCYVFRPFPAELISPSVSASWHDYDFDTKVQAARTADELDRLVRAYHISHFVVYAPALELAQHRVWTEFLDRFTVTELRNGAAFLARYDRAASS